MIEYIKSSKRPPMFWLGVILIAVLLISGTAFVFWPQQAILFSGLAAADAAQITQQLDQKKLPYSLADGGGTILMDPDLIPRARLEVFSGAMNLKSGAGLELFSGNDLGMTEFSQNVNYTRALQGELIRTLLTINGVEAARVHVALPEKTGRRQQTASKVAVTLKSSHPIPPETIRGVQRLIAAAVPGAQQADVVILDGNGSLLTPSRATPSAGGETDQVLSTQLEQKAAIESYLEKKAKKLLSSIVPPPGRAEVIVDVALSERQHQLTREQLLPSGALRGLPVGVLEKARFNRKPSESPAVKPAEEGSATPESQPSTSDDYEFRSGRQVEKIDSPMGATERISVSVVISGTVPPNLDNALRQALKRGLGLNDKRGDDISVLLMPVSSAVAQETGTSATTDHDPVAHQDHVSVPPADTQPSADKAGLKQILPWVLAILAMLVVLGATVRLLFPGRDPEALAVHLRSLLRSSK